MSLRLHDTATRELREFVPVEQGRASIYICGLTVQGPAHIGHVRFAVAFDILRRWLSAGHDLDVTLVRNVTDIDDKILAKSAAAGRQWWDWSYTHERAAEQDLVDLGVLPPTYLPRATGHIPEMLELMDTLVKRGHAYPAPDDSGDVYFDVRSWPDYGELTHQRIDDMSAAEDADPRGKSDPRDFALWKGAKAGEPATASWETAYGRGRPGWHLECSAMARKYLGDRFDIHGGGVDLRFPHHENELAQSRAAGFGFADYWLHNGWVTIGGEKMSKSLGNSLLVSEVLKTTRPLALRYYLGAAHYRSTIEYHAGSLQEAEATVAGIESFLARVVPANEEVMGDGNFPDLFRAAMDDDLNVSDALAVVHDTVRAGNTALDKGDPDGARVACVAVLNMTSVLGINPNQAPWHDDDRDSETLMESLDSLVQERLAARAAARAARDFAAADAIREQLAAAHIKVTDTPAGAQWAPVRRSGSALRPLLDPANDPAADHKIERKIDLENDSANDHGDDPENADG